MEKLTLVEVAPRWEGDASAVLGWPDESWDEYATACVEHVDLNPDGNTARTGRRTPDHPAAHPPAPAPPAPAAAQAAAVPHGCSSPAGFTLRDNIGRGLSADSGTGIDHSR